MYVRFPALGTCFTFLRTSKLTLIACCLPLDNSCMFSRSLYVFPPLEPVASCLALGTSCTFPLAFYVFAPLAPATCFPALCIGYMFSRAWHRLHVFPPLALLACFPTVSTGCIFFVLDILSVKKVWMGGYKCQFSVKILPICQLTAKFGSICQLSVNWLLIINYAC